MVTLGEAGGSGASSPPRCGEPVGVLKATWAGAFPPLVLLVVLGWGEEEATLRTGEVVWDVGGDERVGDKGEAGAAMEPLGGFLPPYIVGPLTLAPKGEYVRIVGLPVCIGRVELIKRTYNILYPFCFPNCNARGSVMVEVCA